MKGTFLDLTDLDMAEKFQQLRRVKSAAGRISAVLAKGQLATCGKPFWISFWGIGEFTTHFRLYFSGDWDVYCGYGMLTHGHLSGQAWFLFLPCSQEVWVLCLCFVAVLQQNVSFVMGGGGNRFYIVLQGNHRLGRASAAQFGTASRG